MLPQEEAEAEAEAEEETSKIQGPAAALAGQLVKSAPPIMKIF